MFSFPLSDKLVYGYFIFLRSVMVDHWEKKNILGIVREKSINEKIII